MNLKLAVLIVVFVGMCGAAIVRKRQAGGAPDEEYNKAVASLSPQQKQLLQNTIALIFSPKEEEGLRTMAKQHTEEPKVFHVIELIRLKFERNFKGDDEGKQFIRYYNEKVSGLKEGTKDEYDSFKKDVVSKWNALPRQSQTQIGAQLGKLPAIH